MAVSLAFYDILSDNKVRFLSSIFIMRFVLDKSMKEKDEINIMAKKDIVIVGSGGLAREVRWLIEDCNKVAPMWNILGWISKEKPGTVISDLPVLGDDEWLVRYDNQIDVAIAVGDGNLREKIVVFLKQNDNLSFPIIISPSAELSDSVILGEGSIITAKSILTVGINIGKFFFCNLSCTVGHDCMFKDYVTLNPGANISGNVNLGNCATIGTGASVIQGISIGDSTTIGAGAAVVRDIPSDCTAVGVPAKPVEKNNEK